VALIPAGCALLGFESTDKSYTFGAVVVRAPILVKVGLAVLVLNLRTRVPSGHVVEKWYAVPLRPYCSSDFLSSDHDYHPRNSRTYGRVLPVD
jgi:hypothetical protein